MVCIGVTSNLRRRVWPHRNDAVDGFGKTCQMHRLVWHARRSTMEGVVLREQQPTKWHRCRKIELIERSNPHRNDLYPSIGAAVGTAGAGFPLARE